MDESTALLTFVEIIATAEIPLQKADEVQSGRQDPGEACCRAQALRAEEKRHNTGGTAISQCDVDKNEQLLYAIRTTVQSVFVVVVDIAPAFARSRAELPAYDIGPKTGGVVIIR